ncbi:ABC transporter ATP-binding protein [Paramaledivibacter caminithermalis]|jgi:ABC-2 type transport system ATP-binding protein|uniref:ABC-2 type transport system ATP-binding protein n=1 Tax=Paramaledivibacter caminithermalis (strain DSM 15212 / CIP 107654 / DViRD3) TaxID=1121301 RepID=A0A1M6QQC8_PARC5|nr:ABC transporter ATP-binding protein [Paramaledivibacter caminithermalis]SHK22461.1 ABC-2 type transport system ATP-binding protein [Paramaledivibacter caminithermalis DSM 15212]
MIEFKNVTKRYSNGCTAIEELNLKIKSGQIYGLIGPNGAGKTTLLRMLMGIIPVTEGDIMVMGECLAKNPVKIKAMIGYVSDEIANFERLRGREYLNFIADIYCVEHKKRHKLIKYYGECFEIYYVLDRYIKEYSYGMKKKLNIIGALIHEPTILVMDEPLTGLDPKSSYQIKTCIKEYTKENKLVLFSSHILEVVERLCNRIAIINKGKIVLEGKLEQIRDNISCDTCLEKIFLEVTNNND